MNNMRKHKYFVSYSYTNHESTANGFGDVLVEIQGKLTYSKIDDIRTKLKEFNNLSAVIILNVIRLKA